MPPLHPCALLASHVWVIILRVCAVMMVLGVNALSVLTPFPFDT